MNEAWNTLATLFTEKSYLKLQWWENERMSLQQGDTMTSQYFTKEKSICNGE